MARHLEEKPMKRRSTLLVTASLVLTMLTLTAHADVLDEIDARYASGAIDEGTLHLYRLQALHDRSALPADLAAMPLGASARVRGTAVHVEAAQWLKRTGSSGGPVARMLAPPPDDTYTLDSTTLPIRVTWNDASLEAFAAVVLSTAEHSWTVETADYGFAAPVIEEGAERFRIHIGPTGMGGGAYTAPYDYDISQPYASCYSYILVDDANAAYIDYTDYIGAILAHELNHAMQGTMDCAEITPFWENTATYIMGQVYPGDIFEVYYMITEMQKLPWKAIDYMSSSGQDYYEYGGALWAYYLATTYAPTDGPIFMREIWEAARQMNWDNSVTYLQAIEAVASVRASEALTMADIYPGFAESRYFLGTDSDGAHIPNANQFTDCEVTAAKRVTAAAFPIVGDAPVAANLPEQYGSNHIIADVPSSYPYPIEVSFDGDDAVRWSAEVALVGGGATETFPITLDSTTRAGSTTVSMNGHSKLVLVVANLTTEAYDPNTRAWSSSAYTYSMEPVYPTPTVTAVEPAEIEQGAVDVAMTVTGTSFLQGGEFGVAFDDAGIVIKQVVSVSATEIHLIVDVPATVVLGTKDVTVTNMGGAQASGLDLFSVVEPPTPPDPGDDDSGCGCRAGGTTSSAGGLLLAGLFLLAVRRRRA
jgi:MYXO-CTERM domain-containing protein